MDQINHKHNWQVLCGAEYTANGKDYPAVFHCKECQLKLHTSDAIQFDLLKFTVGWNKWMSLVAIVISAASLIISILALLKNLYK